MSLVCEKCGSLEIQEKAWVDVNTQKYMSSVKSDDEEDNWCTVCEEHVSFIDEDEYKLKDEDYQTGFLYGVDNEQ